MNFILSAEIVDDVIFAMENQNDLFVFDTAQGMCVSTTGDLCATDDDASGEDRYYDIPVWTSAHGFRVMEQFAALVHNPPLRKQLQDALAQGKGVFRRYKSILKTNPAIEQEWYRFKEQQMKAAVYEWYNDLRTVWGLEKMSFEEEETGTLLHQDFSFELERDNRLNYRLLQAFIARMDENGNAAGWDEKAGICTCPVFRSAVTALAGRLLPAEQPAAETVLLTAHTQEEICAVCLLCKIPDQLCFTLPFLRVCTAYRGLGIGKELLQRACTYAEQQKAALIFADLCTPSYFLPQLTRNGFRQTGLIYVKG